MNTKTQAIVLHLSPHKENASILHLYTRSHGRLQFLVYGKQGRSKKGLQALLEPLSLLNIEAVLQDNKPFGQLRECSFAYVPQALMTDHRRRCVALFMAEMLCLTLTHPQQDVQLFDFLSEYIHELDQCSDPQNVHLRFLMNYAAQLGFAIDFTDPQNQAIALFLDPQEPDTFSGAGRKNLLHSLLQYYATHIPDFTMPNSLPVLEAVFAPISAHHG